MAKNRITLNLCGCEFALCSEGSEADVRSVAAEVQKTIDESMEKNKRLSVTMAALLAAMDYCDASRRASASADNLRSQIKNYLEDSSHARMDAEESRRELERVRRENQTLRARLAAAGETVESSSEPQKAQVKPSPTAGKPESASDPDQESFMSFFEKKTDDRKA